MEKTRLRKKHLDARDMMSKEEREQKSRQIQEKVLGLPQLREADFILPYMDYRSEVMTTELVNQILMGKLSGTGAHRVFCPVVEGMDIFFYEITSLEQLKSGYQDIREPVPAVETMYTDKIVGSGRSVVLAPGAVFDRQGGRIGYGKGFYDRFLAKFPQMFSIGLAFSSQLTMEIPMDEMDQRINMIVTEQEIIHTYA